MKKLLMILCAMLLMAGCSNTTTSTNETNPVSIEPLTFEQQVKLAGIEYSYTNPNEKNYEFESTDPTLDIQTGASGDPLYVNDSIAPTIRTAQDLVNRKVEKYWIYEWVEDEAGVSTLEEAVKLEKAEFVSDLFPNDGKKYSIKESKNSLGTTTLVTVNAEGEPNVAVFGLNFVNDENDASKVLLSGTVMAYTETVSNILNGSPILVSYYEYDPTNSLKMGVGSRNAGARVECEIDKDLTKVNGTKKDGEETAPSMTLAEYEALSEADKEAFGINSMAIRAKVVAVYSIG